MDLADSLPRLNQINICAAPLIMTRDEVENTIKRNVLDFDFRGRMPLLWVPPDISIGLSAVCKYEEADGGMAGRYQEVPQDG